MPMFGMSDPNAQVSTSSDRPYGQVMWTHITTGALQMSRWNWKAAIIRVRTESEMDNPARKVVHQ